MKNNGFKLSKESVDKMTTVKGIDTSKYVEITDVDELSSGKSLSDLIFEAYKAAMKEEIRANTILISKRIAKAKRFEHIFAGGIMDIPPMIYGLEAYVTDELPEEFAFGLVEAPTTQREKVFEEGRRTGYKEGYQASAREIFEEIEKFMSPYRYPILAELKKKYTEEG